MRSDLIMLVDVLACTQMDEDALIEQFDGFQVAKVLEERVFQYLVAEELVHHLE